MSHSLPIAPAGKTVHRAHLLEIIPFFRRYRQSWWPDLVYTFIWNTLLAPVLPDVNLRCVAGPMRDDTGQVTVRLKNHGDVLPVSRAYAHRFKQM